MKARRHCRIIAPSRGNDGINDRRALAIERKRSGWPPAAMKLRRMANCTLPVRDLLPITDIRFLTERERAPILFMLFVVPSLRLFAVVCRVCVRSNTVGGKLRHTSKLRNRLSLEGMLSWCSRTETTFAWPRPTKNFSSLMFRMTHWSALPPLSAE
jgi:hypothetical protein